MLIHDDGRSDGRLAGKDIAGSMKILIISDSHGHHDLVRRAIGQEAPIDLLIHAGDVEGDLAHILGDRREYEIRAVAGNMDWSDSLEDELCFPVCGHTIYVAHGHRLGVHGGTGRLVRRARELGADIAIYGHTHMPDYGKEEGVLVINPGSVAKPRQEGWRKSYAVMTIDEDGEVKVKFKYLPKRPFF